MNNRFQSQTHKHRIHTRTLQMAEIEEFIAIEGFPLIDKKGKDKCCEHAEVDGYTCDWTIERIVLPEFGFEQNEDGDDATKNTNGNDINLWIRSVRK